MQQFTPGQRWVSDTELELGLGTLIERQGRQVKLLFEASGETRAYALPEAPLTRVAFGPGEHALVQDGGRLLVQESEERDGLLHYHGLSENGEQLTLPEAALDPNQSFSRPQQRLMRGQLDHPRWFSLRHQTLSQRHLLAQQPTWGLAGGRTDLLPHQLYITHEVSQRQSPRVLLADEVGLGKTIEAGMILHRMLLTGRAARVLVLVPDALIHQWLVEMIRRFNLMFSVFDEDRCQAICESAGSDNPFQQEQLVLCSLSLFKANPQRHSQALNAGWDLLVVDEAHHLAWDEQSPSVDYRIVEQFAHHVPGLLLLTATPEQLGRSGHFARLRLLDPDRFHDLAAFEQEEADFAPVAEAVETLLADADLPDAAFEALLTLLQDDDGQLLLGQCNSDDPELREAAREQLIRLLLDRHGTGRVMFRNTRARISGFPERELHPWPLDLPNDYRELLAAHPAEQAVTPEHLYREQGLSAAGDWWRIDPRVDWLVALARRMPQEKLLLICAHAQTALDLERALRTGHGLLAGVFHEAMSIVERDRAAAWFADPEDGCQLLICSEIGSEGRNFQFSHHLVLFDLPLNPDLLEQRIGRLDRIGQRDTIRLHVPYFSDSPSEVLFRWYQDGLDAFGRTCPEGQAVYRQLSPALLDALDEPADVDALLDAARQLAGQTREALANGRDHLLELGSCRQPQADQLVEQIQERDADLALGNYLQQLADCFGLELEDHSAQSYILRPSNHMSIDAFPGLPDEGLTLTRDRATALAHEDRHFLTWEHQLIRNAIDLVLTHPQGQSSLIALKGTGMKNALLLECLFVVESIAPRALQADRFLPPTLIRLLVDASGRDWSARLTPELLDNKAVVLDKRTGRGLIDKMRSQIDGLLKQAEQAAEAKLQPLLNDATARMLNYYSEEIERLTQLQKVNPSVRDDEIDELQAEGLALHQLLGASQLRLDALRVVLMA